MILHAWRICKRRHAARAFSGEGARLYGGRWNSKGVSVIYASESAALAALEMLVHLQSPHHLASYVLVQIALDDLLIEQLDVKRLPKNWRTYSVPRELQTLGDQWLARQSSAVLRVPSAIVETEHNFLLNPAHPDFSAIHIGKPRAFQFDPRLKS